MYDGILDAPEVLELTNNRLLFPLPLEGFVGVLPLAASAHRSVLAWWNPASFHGFKDIHEGNACPRTSVFKDCPRDNLAWHCAGNEVSLPVLAGNGLAAVCHVMWMQFDHWASVQRIEAIPDADASVTAESSRDWLLWSGRPLLERMSIPQRWAVSSWDADCSEDRMNISTVLRFHQEWFYVAVVSTGLVGAWGLTLAVMKRQPGRWFGYARAVAIAAMLIQIGAGVILYSNDLRPGNSFHIFYGVVIAVTLTLAYLYRSTMAKRPALTYGILLLFVMGLGIRAWMNVS